MKKKKYVSFFMPSLIVLLLISGVIVFPSQSIKAASHGLDIWTSILIPSLLPFIIGANLLVSLKVVDIIGLIINPITNFIFNVSGKSALVFAISTVSGYPVGAKLASELRDNKEISVYEAQRLVSFCSTSGPLFIVGSVATGMLGNPSLGYLMLFSHYLACICLGILFRRYGRETLVKSSSSLKSNINSIIDSKFNEGSGFFVLFGNAVFNGVNTLLAVGGFVIVFSVVFEVLSLLNVVSLLATLIYIPLSVFGFTYDLCNALISGLFEMTIGCNNISALESTSEVLRASLCSFLIGFSGLSILAQCCNFISKTDINTNLYILSKIGHGILAFCFTFLLYPLFGSSSLVSTFSSTYNVLFDNNIYNYYLSNLNVILVFISFIYLSCLFFNLSRVNFNRYTKSYK